MSETGMADAGNGNGKEGRSGKCSLAFAHRAEAIVGARVNESLGRERGDWRRMGERME